MIEQILIEEGGMTTSYRKVLKLVKKLTKKTQKSYIIIPAQGLVKDFSGKIYGIFAICLEEKVYDKYHIERVVRFIENFRIDYQHKLLDLNFLNERNFKQIFKRF